MRSIEKISVCLLLTCLSVACSSRLDLSGLLSGSSSRADQRFAESMHYQDSVGYAHWVVPETYRVYVCSDTHLDSVGDHVRAFAYAYKSDTACALAIHLGDLIDGQHHHALFFESMGVVPSHYRLGKDTICYLVGNHDLFFGQWDIFRQYCHSSTYWLDTRTADGRLLDLFICLDSGEGTLGEDALQWFEQTLRTKSQEGYRHIIVCSHTGLFKTHDIGGHTSNFSMEETCRLAALMRDYRVELYLNGHAHHRDSVRYEGVDYITVPALKMDAQPAQFICVEMGKKIVWNWIEVDSK